MCAACSLSSISSCLWRTPPRRVCGLGSGQNRNPSDKWRVQAGETANRRKTRSVNLGRSLARAAASRTGSTTQADDRFLGDGRRVEPSTVSLLGWPRK
jgi:hypothetical protein